MTIALIKAQKLPGDEEEDILGVIAAQGTHGARRGIRCVEQGET